MQKKKIALVLHLVLIVLDMIGLVYCIFEYGGKFIQFYTNLSNIMALIISSISAFYIYLDLKYNTNNTPRYIKKLRYFVTVCLSITFSVVAFVLAPPSGIGGFIYFFTHGSALYHHLLVPVISFALLFLEDNKLKFTDTFYALIPTVLYGVVMLILNAIGYLFGPYPFLMITLNPPIESVASISLIVVLAYLLGLINYWIIKKINK